MYCNNCGKQIDDKAVFCVHCGVSTITPNVPVVQSAFINPVPTNGVVIAGFVLSLIGFVSGALLIISVLGLILSSVGVQKSKHPFMNGNGRGFGTAGIVLSCSSLCFGIMIIILVYVLVIGGSVAATV